MPYYPPTPSAMHDTPEAYVKFAWSLHHKLNGVVLCGCAPGTKGWHRSRKRARYLGPLLGELRDGWQRWERDNPRAADACVRAVGPLYGSILPFLRYSGGSLP